MEATIASEVSQSILHAIPMLIQFPKQRFWVDYDAEADVLYINFQRPQKATKGYKYYYDRRWTSFAL